MIPPPPTRDHKTPAMTPYAYGTHAADDLDSGAMAPSAPPACPARTVDGGQNAPAIWGGVPPRNPNFIGRHIPLEHLEQRLADGAAVVLPSAMHGMGGIGKTQLAIEYVYRHLNDYDLVWWIQAAQPGQIHQALTALAQRLGLPCGIDTAIPVVLDALRRGQTGGRWLLVFDSADSPHTVRPYLPAHGRGHVLITSRNPHWAEIARPLKISVFTREESVALLRRRVATISDADAAAIADRLGDLPLAVAQAGAWLAQTAMPAAEYLAQFDDNAAAILDTDPPGGYDVSVAAAWTVSFTALRDRDPAAHQLLQVCAFFASDPINLGLFRAVRGVSIAPDLDHALASPLLLARATRAISRLGLARIDLTSDTLVLHRSVQQVLRDQMGPDHRTDMHRGAQQLLATYDPGDPDIPSLWPRYHHVLPHVSSAALVDSASPGPRQLVLNLMAFLYLAGDHDGAAALARAAHASWSAASEVDDPYVLTAAERLSYFLWVLGRYPEAAEISRSILGLRRRSCGENSQETLAAQNAIAHDLKARGDFPGARDITRSVFTKATALFGVDDPHTLDAARAYGISLRLCGQYGPAAEVDQACYERHVVVRGYDHPDTLSVLSGWILDRREAGEYAWAVRAHEELADRAATMFGDGAADTLRRQVYLAVALRKAGDYPAALDLSRRVLDGFRARYSPHNFNALACAVAQSIDLRRAEKLGAACKLGETVSQDYTASLGEAHPHSNAAAINLAVTVRLTGDHATARELNERALQSLWTTVGADHPYSIACGINLASDCAAAGDTQAALDMGAEMSDRAIRTLGADHPTTLAARANHALDLGEHGQSAADIIAAFGRVLGAEHPATTAATARIRLDCDIDPIPL